jgi:murein DD-endopeptidase MepM/ murein hydrolase activator NlpD
LKRHVLIIAAILMVALGWYNNRGPGSGAVDRMWGVLTRPFRIARLIAQPADKVLLVPVEGVGAHRIANTWHALRGSGRKHQGLDIFARRGTPVLAAADGVVVRIGENHLGGRTVSVLGRGGRTYYYAHLQEYAARMKVGDEVARGTVIGFVGNSGNARTTPPHLHFGVYTPAGAINPLPLLARPDAAS